ncbi:MAG: pirin family protein [Bacteroidia bacterium]|nr:pirin family protein [Bacteroidia bacterium]
MAVNIIPVAYQAEGAFDWGNILENKPVGFPQEEGGVKSFSTLFYWAHAFSKGGGEIGLHPHKGFEILSYVLKGEIQHYDTLLKKWIPLKEGDLQIIRAGSGVSHAERLGPDSEIFQIWIDPGLHRTLSLPASYDDFSGNDFPQSQENQEKRIHFTGENSPLKMMGDAQFERRYFAEGKAQIEIPAGKILAAYVIEGEFKLENGQKAGKDDFIQVMDQEIIDLNVLSSGNLFLIFVPARPAYQTYLNN